MNNSGKKDKCKIYSLHEKNLTLNLLKKDDAKVGIKSRTKMAGWRNDYLLKLIRS